MPFSANCPACGAPVAFKSSASFHAVCEFCHSTLVRHGSNLENLGRMADLLEDASPIRLGTEGRYHGVHFATIGRIQLRYAAGVWNEWHVLFDDMRSGWLSDAGGEYTMTFLTPPGVELPPFAKLMPNDTQPLAGRDFVVSNLEEAMCVAGEGELPFPFGAGYPAQVADLREADGSGFASIDYSEAPPLVFVGEILPFTQFHFANLRGEETPKTPGGVITTLQCPRCGSPIGIHDKAVQSVACPSCLTVLEHDNASLKVLQKAAAATRIEPLIPLGSTGRFVGKEWTVIGFQQRGYSYHGTDYAWEEYLLHHREEGFRWLVESEGHWNWVSPVANPPAYQVGLPAVSYAGESYKRFAQCEAETRYVIGEFNWKVTVGESWVVLDFTAPPLALSREAKDNEIAWSTASYLTPEEVATAFGLKQALPTPRGIGMNQPNPRAEPHRSVCSRFWQFAMLALLAQALWVLFFGGSTVLDHRLVFSHGKEEAVTTPTFRLERGARTLVLRHDTDLDNNWLGVNTTLIEKASGRAWLSLNDVSYWHGSEDGESWSEGERWREVVFRDLPPGDYYLAIDPELSDENRAAVADRLRAIRDPAPWSNFFMLLVFLAIFPIYSRFRVAGFEAERWRDADFASTGADFHAAGGSSDSDGGDFDSGDSGGGDD